MRRECRLGDHVDEDVSGTGVSLGGRVEDELAEGEFPAFGGGERNRLTRRRRRRLNVALFSDQSADELKAKADGGIHVGHHGDAGESVLDRCR